MKQTVRSRKPRQNKMNSKRYIQRHIIMKMVKFKDKERILKAAREKQLVTYQGNLRRLSTDFSAESLQVGREGMTYSKY